MLTAATSPFRKVRLKPRVSRDSSLNNQHTITMPVAKKEIPALTEDNKKRFLAKVSATPTDKGCLEWTAFKNPAGYGMVRIGSRRLRAHRVAYLIHHGEEPGELCVCHSCDNPACCNPEHFFLGSHGDNMRDMEAKGRGNKARDGSHGRSKLTDEQVSYIRSSPLNGPALARELGVHHTQIYKIISGKSRAPLQQLTI